MVDKTVLLAVAQNGPIRRLRPKYLSTDGIIGSGRSGRLLSEYKGEAGQNPSSLRCPTRKTFGRKISLRVGLFPLHPQRPSSSAASRATVRGAYSAGWVAAGEGGNYHAGFALPFTLLLAKCQKWGNQLAGSGRSASIPIPSGRIPRCSCQLAKVVALPLKFQATRGRDLGPTCAFLTASRSTLFSLREGAAKTMRISLARRVGRKALGALIGDTQ